jgi:hypothetical protein
MNIAHSSFCIGTRIPWRPVRQAPLPTVSHSDASPLWAINALTFVASIGTGVVWNGVAFVAKHAYEYDRIQTLALYVAMGGVYVLGAMTAGRGIRLVEKRIAPRTLLGLILVVESLICLGPMFTMSQVMLWTIGIGVSLLSSWVWPIVESYVTAGRHGEDMRNSIGWWNLSWTIAVAASLWLMAPMIEHDAQMALVILGPFNALGLIPLIWFRCRPGAHDDQLSAASVGREYQLLLHAARVLLPLSYVLNAAMSPLLPYLFERFDLNAWWETPVAATWMSVRVVAMTLMWRLGFWHGRWGTLLLGGLTMCGGFALIVLSPALWVMMMGLATFGAGMGVIYYAAIYYAMAVGKAEVDAGGTHEALIGLGYTMGPIAGFVGIGLGGAMRNAGWQIWDGTGIVVVVLMLTGAGAAGAVRPYFTARKRR